MKCVCVCVFITAAPITKLFACVFITAVHITKLFAWGEGGDSGGHVKCVLFPAQGRV
jgi:hypothetical protein